MRRVVVVGCLLGLAACVTSTPTPAPLQASLPPPPASWATLREPVAYDGDTLYVVVTVLPPELTDMSVRVRGIDTPEMRGTCAAEKELAVEARDYTRSLVASGEVTFEDVEWDKYGGRVLADVRVDGQPLADLLIARGLARSYDGGRRQSWCGP